ncbi:MAG: N-acetylmuramoyl-L-alanine amidase [Oscillospiraceae bacterium]|nr:N-acetylmuramoyl-L-alanine amidase [Oscillospiraceae bacterium]
MALEIRKQFLTKNDCYKAGRKITPSGIVVHSTGANNPNLNRYVAPDDGVLGKNKYNNDWNRSGISKCVHAFIGKAADGTVKVYQTLPWDHRAWGVASGKKGSYNNSHIQFEICEDNLNNADYYKKAFDAAAELCAYLCKEYSIPVSNVVGHYEAYAAGYGNNHADPRNWQKKHGDSMNAFRERVAALIGGVKVETPAEQPKQEAASTETATIYTVQKGDSLWKIASKHLGSGTKYKQIQSVNGMNDTLIHVGQKLKIPKA